MATKTAYQFDSRQHHRHLQIIMASYYLRVINPITWVFTTILKGMLLKKAIITNKQEMSTREGLLSIQAKRECKTSQKSGHTKPSQ
jgi:hypothetical protein